MADGGETETDGHGLKRSLYKLGMHKYMTSVKRMIEEG